MAVVEIFWNILVVVLVVCPFVFIAACALRRAARKTRPRSSAENTPTNADGE